MDFRNRNLALKRGVKFLGLSLFYLVFASFSSLQIRRAVCRADQRECSNESAADYFELAPGRIWSE